MFENQADNLQVDMALREGLRALPVPSVSDEFDARVLAAIQGPQPWWQAVLPGIRPLMAGGVCSMALTLLLVRWAIQVPLNEPARGSRSNTVAGIDSQQRSAAEPVGNSGGQFTALDDALDRGDLTSSTLARLARPIVKTAPR